MSSTARRINEDLAFGTECPLPSYEQACASRSEIGFKGDVRFVPPVRATGPSTRDERTNLRDESEELDDVPVKHKCIKYCCVAITVLTIIIFLLIVININVGKSNCHNYSLFQNTGYEQKISNIKDLFDQCTEDKESFQRKFTSYEQKISSIKDLFDQCVVEKESLQRKITSHLSDTEIKDTKEVRRSSEKEITNLNDVIGALFSKLTDLSFENELLKHNVLPTISGDDQTTKTTPSTISTPITTVESADRIFNTIPSSTTTVENVDHIFKELETLEKLLRKISKSKKESHNYNTEKSV